MFDRVLNKHLIIDFNCTYRWNYIAAFTQKNYLVEKMKMEHLFWKTYANGCFWMKKHSKILMITWWLQHILKSVIYFICATFSITASFSVAFGRFRSCCTVVDFTRINFHDLAKNSKTSKQYSDKNFWLQGRAD